jgi:hypothetical protein
MLNDLSLFLFSFLQALLHFIYWDSLPDMQELTGMNTKWATTLMAQHLLAAADRYALERLRLICEAGLCEDVAINTVATTLALAEQHHCFQLKAVCLKFIATSENLRGIFLSKVIILNCSLIKDCILGSTFNTKKSELLANHCPKLDLLLNLVLCEPVTIMPSSLDLNEKKMLSCEGIIQFYY